MRGGYLILAGMLALLVACGAPLSAQPITTISAASATQPVAPTDARRPVSTPILTTPTLTETRATSATGQATAMPEATAMNPPVQPARVNAAALPDAAAFTWQPVLTGLSVPVFVTGAGDGSHRLFIVLQSGQIMVFQDGAMFAETFLDISDRTSPPRNNGAYGERGLLGLAFHPRFIENGFFYVNYTDSNGDTIISRFQVSPGDRQGDDAASETRLLSIAQPYPNHNGGMLAFGPDGYLYIGLGDGGSAGDPQGNAQSDETLLGKILRIDVDSGSPYATPADNPFANGGGLPEIWSKGLRNPWRFSFDRLTGDLYIGDVGQNQWEEVNFQPAGSRGGANYGWDYREARHAYDGSAPAGIVFVEPVTEYDHGKGCSISGGVVYRGMNLPEWQGVYFYGDYCSGRIWGLLRNADGSWQNQELFETGMNIPSFGQDDDGEIYLIDYSGGVVYRLGRK